jgi:hypothetical protein
MGTALYLSPEQYADSAGVDTRTDIYAMGEVLYECITGHTPYYGASQRDLLLKMLTTNPPSLSELRPELPAGLDAIVAKAMAKDVAERYQSIDELVDVLLPFAAAQLPNADSILVARSSQLPPQPTKRSGASWLVALSVLVLAQVYGLYWAATSLQGVSPESVLRSTKSMLAGFFLPSSLPALQAPDLPRSHVLGADAAVEVMCEIPGAELYINGERVGVVVSGAPIHLSLPAGLYRFEALRDGAVVAADMRLVQAGTASSLRLRTPTVLLQAKAPAFASTALVSTAPRSPLEDGELTEREASLSQAQLSDVIKAHLDGLQRCYEAALQGSSAPEEPGALELELAIAATGEVTAVRTQGSTLAGLDACFEQSARGWVFPQAASATQLRFPLVFRRMGNSQLSSTQLSQVFARSKSTLQRCNTGSERVLKLEVDMEVLPSGAVSSVSIDGAVPEVDACISRAVRTWQFPTALEATHTRFPVLLLPGA